MHFLSKCENSRSLKYSSPDNTKFELRLYRCTNCNAPYLVYLQNNFERVYSMSEKGISEVEMNISTNGNVTYFCDTCKKEIVLKN